MKNRSERTNSVLIYQDFIKKTSGNGYWRRDNILMMQNMADPRNACLALETCPSCLGSVSRRLPGFHLLLGVDAVAMTVQSDAVMHAPVAGGRHPEKPACPLID
jgi:hypothetical protein